jgi:hypothetical protein
LRLAYRLLLRLWNAGGRTVQYTIEARQLTGEHSRRPVFEAEPKAIVIEAATADEAISQFLSENKSELVSLSRPLRGSESIATVRKDDSVFLLRIYTA